MAEPFDLHGYLDRIGVSGEVAPTYETLVELHRRHVMTFPFENINPLMGWPVPLDMGSLQTKFITDGRGGYCYEQNLVFKAALEAIGFQVNGLAARVMIARPHDSPPPPRTHMLLRVDIDGQSYLADTGFGGNTLSSPIRLEADTVQSTSHDRRRLVYEDGEYTMQVEIHGEWRTLYRFPLVPYHLSDYEVCNWYVSTNPRSHFTKMLAVARVTPTGRYTLRNNDFAEHSLDGTTHRRLIPTLDELLATLKEVFLLNVPKCEDLDKRLQGLMQQH